MTGRAGMDGELSIDSFRPRDRCEIVDLIVAIQREEFGIPIDAEDQPDLNSIRDYYQKGAGGFWVARASGQVVGTIGLKDIGDSAGALRKMFVAASHRGRAGVAARLLERLLARARERKLRRLYLGTTAAFAAAHRFYEKNGFRRLDPAGLPPRFPRMAVDSIFYVLETDDS